MMMVMMMMYLSKFTDIHEKCRMSGNVTETAKCFSAFIIIKTTLFVLQEVCQPPVNICVNIIVYLRKSLPDRHINILFCFNFLSFFSLSLSFFLLFLYFFSFILSVCLPVFLSSSSSSSSSSSPPSSSSVLVD